MEKHSGDYFKKSSTSHAVLGTINPLLSPYTHFLQSVEYNNNTKLHRTAHCRIHQLKTSPSTAAPLRWKILELHRRHSTTCLGKLWSVMKIGWCKICWWSFSCRNCSARRPCWNRQRRRRQQSPRRKPSSKVGSKAQLPALPFVLPKELLAANPIRRYTSYYFFRYPQISSFAVPVVTTSVCPTLCWKSTARWLWAPATKHSRRVGKLSCRRCRIR